MSSRKKKDTEAVVDNSIDTAQEQPTASEDTHQALMSMEEYVKKANINKGLVASFRYERIQAGDTLYDRTEEEWRVAFEEQANRQYL